MPMGIPITAEQRRKLLVNQQLDNAVSASIKNICDYDPDATIN
jgi:hypothetical protein